MNLFDDKTQNILNKLEKHNLCLHSFGNENRNDVYANFRKYEKNEGLIYSSCKHEATHYIMKDDKVLWIETLEPHLFTLTIHSFLNKFP